LARPDDPVAHVEFALRYEAFDLGVLVAALDAIEKTRLEEWVRSSPTSAFARRAWFLYERFVGDQLDVPDLKMGNYVDALDEDRFITSAPVVSPRHRVRDNLLGVPGFNPTVRVTERLTQRVGERWNERLRAVAAAYDPRLLLRAASYLYTKESKASYAIEGETPGPDRLERFVNVLRQAGTFDTTSTESLLSLQSAIFDPRFATPTWRTTPIYVGQTLGFNTERGHFVGPRPDDLLDLMAAWAGATDRLLGDGVDPVIAAAVASFGFVFLHPLPDGNGRVHRFLIHNVLARRGFTPDGVLFPVSAAMLRDRGGYDAALETFSKRLLPCVSWEFDQDGTFLAKDVDPGHYRYVDLTPLVEYLYDKVAVATDEDLREELAFLDAYDRAFEAVQRIVDMPDRDISLFVRLVMQNGGTLSKAKRGYFDKLTDDEVSRMEDAVRRATAEAEAD
jgi:hypothetical protein